MARLLVTAMFALTALIILALVLIVRRIRRRRIMTPTALRNEPGSSGLESSSSLQSSS
jgi:hypothetical protein